MAELYWRIPGEEEQRAAIPSGGVVLGRSPGTGVRIAHPSVSRRHARLVPEVSGSWRITDLGSRNGVIVRSRRVHETELAPGDPIQLGNVVLWVREEPSAGAPPAPGPGAEAENALDRTERRNDAAQRDGAAELPRLDAEVLLRLLEGDTPPVSHPSETQPGSPTRPAPVGPAARALPAASAGPALLAASPAPVNAAAATPEATLDGSPTGEAGAPSAAAVPRERLFRASERGILIGVALLSATAIALLTFGPRRERAEPALPVPPVPAPLAADPAAPVDSTELAASLLPAVEETPVVARIEELSPAEVERSWRAAVFLFGRGPTPAETAAEPEALLAAAPALPEHWRHRARAWIGDPLPRELLPAEVPLDLADWGARVRRLAAAGATGAPLPDGSGDDREHEDAFRHALGAPWRIADLGGALRTAWTAGAGRALDAEVEGWIDELAASGIPAEELLGRFVALVAPAHPAVRRGGEAMLRGLPPVEGGLPEEAAIPAELRFAVEVERRLPRFPEPAPAVGPPGALRIEVLATFPIRPLFDDPARIPRLWRRLDRSRLTLCAPSAASPAELFARASSPAPREAWILAEGSAEGVERARVRIADGFLLPALADIARRLALHPAREALPADAVAWLARARGGRDTAGERLFRAGGYQLVPGEWRAAAYRPATRALLLAGAQLLESPGTDAVVRIRLDEEPSAGAEGEWAEWTTALELVAGRCEEHPIALWLWAPAAGGSGSEAVAIEWGPEVRRGWVVEEERPGEAVHPRLAAELAAPAEGGKG